MVASGVVVVDEVVEEPVVHHITFCIGALEQDWVRATLGRGGETGTGLPKGRMEACGVGADIVVEDRKRRERMAIERMVVLCWWWWWCFWDRKLK